MGHHVTTVVYTDRLQGICRRVMHVCRVGEFESTSRILTGVLIMVWWERGTDVRKRYGPVPGFVLEVLTFTPAFAEMQRRSTHLPNMHQHQEGIRMYL